MEEKSRQDAGAGEDEKAKDGVRDGEGLFSLTVWDRVRGARASPEPCRPDSRAEVRVDFHS
jgi:hypothetical protein